MLIFLLCDNSGKDFFAFFSSLAIHNELQKVHSKISDVRSTVETHFAQDHSWEWRKMRKWEMRNDRARPGFAVCQLWPLHLVAL